MPSTVDNPLVRVFETWGDAMEEVTEGNYSTDNTSAVAKTPFARLLLMGNYGTVYDLEGNETATELTFQVDSFASGQYALTKVYDIDDVSHQTLVSLGFQRNYGPTLTENADPSIRRVVSRYKMLYTGLLLGESE